MINFRLPPTLTSASIVFNSEHKKAIVSMPQADEQSRRNPEQHKAPNPLWAIVIAVLIIIGFVIAIFMTVSPALAP